MITGGTGSFGNAVLDRFLKSSIKEVRILSRNEKKQDDMRHKYHNEKIKFYIGDVRNRDSLVEAVSGADYVFHAAALKQVSDHSNAFVKKLYATYLSYLPPDSFSYPLKMSVDDRGSFTEFLKTPDRGQVSVNISKPGIVKGNHWHHTKVEKFLVVNGKGVIRFRKIGSDQVVEYHVSAEDYRI